MRRIDDDLSAPPCRPCGLRPPGRVSLVGAGPGDPDLLTVKAARLLGQAGLVLHDALVGPGVLDLVPPQARRIDVGKRCGRHALRQHEITALMIALARGGRALVRLKGGDPFVFGRGGEEAEALAAAGIPFEVVPGISAAQGAAAAFGLPLTHRDHAQRLVLATGHGRDDEAGGEPALDWPALARPGQTLVFYMGLRALPQICAALVAHGLPAATPAATIERASTADQRITHGSLATLPARVLAQQVQAPALIVVGTVLALQPVLAAALAVRPAAPALVPAASIAAVNVAVNVAVSAAVNVAVSSALSAPVPARAVAESPA
ncbi:uroporphyrinogen-III C-methyltransferase [Aquabacterium sp. OR-4]|uniref:uroporphyrinogen-III C-methyltransferase n=1 Tax=Aquabacterium sp. OR-4 TaxID=2978127 RepID=UPI0028C6007A|nr:uroporphyrinogen-III C-methyltransferase [Aquabacterium sp. OR-4]MDT7838715.1 uroporphyrinogen-III C-methyltransferase [Aquabacterium sp. OR-4]